MLNTTELEIIDVMKKLLLIAALALAALTMRAQERINDTVVDGVRYAILLDSRGDVKAYKSATPFNEAQAVIDLNDRLRSIAIYQTVAVPCAVAAPFALLNAYSANPKYGMPNEPMYKCDRPALAAIGYVAAAASLVCGIMSYVQLWTPRLYVNQEGLVFRLDGKSTKYYKHEFNEKDDE